ncbi:polysaccharide deacetylase family protein [Dyella solisilvae]|uniref:Polysaccharide deacetylase family protein n=1 Tax=Dyella solisilvae TaxID=1920168 RepID=A0A370KCS2_9GAMM|nr:polysaccharide deacetylase family protein [Dyella solisilvae]RDI99910.1 polysaccharide deacetylase family protein [Dyella solisilvae]
MYHNVARAPKDAAVYRSLYVSPGAFARQMGLLRVLGYRGVSMSDAMPYLRGEKQGRVAVITLDDGYVDNVESALAALRRYGFTATCYVVSGRIGQYNVWDADKLGVRKPLMSVEQLRSWHDAGMEVGAHTRTHVRLSQCDDQQQQDEIQGSKEELEDRLGVPVTQFCYPYGDHDARAVEVARKAGYAAATTTQRGRAQTGPDINLWRLPRIQVARHHVLPQVAAKLLTGYEDQRS